MKKLYEETNIQAIAEKIRSKASVSSTFKTSEMPSGIESVYAKGYSDGASSSGVGGGIIPSGEISITENGTFDVTAYATAVVEVASSGGGDVVTGTFDIVNPKDGKMLKYQVTTADFVLEFDIGAHDISNFVAVLDDPEKDAYQNDRDMIFGNLISNGNTSRAAPGSTTAENVSFLDPSAQYARYDKATGKMYVHYTQWCTIKCGKYRFLAW